MKNRRQSFYKYYHKEPALNVITMFLWCQNDVTASFWYHNDVIIALTMHLVSIERADWSK